MTVEIIDNGLAEQVLRAQLGRARRAKITVGIHGDKTQRVDGDSLTNAQVGAFHEFGTATIPERPFLGGTFDNRRSQIGAFIDRAAVAILEGHATTEQALGQAAQSMAGEVQEYISDGIEPGLGPAAIEARSKRLSGGKPANNRFGGDKPLILSGQLRQSIAGQVSVRGGGES
jgi:hypothetical protein